MKLRLTASVTLALAVLCLLVAVPASAGIVFSVRIGPPPIAAFDQPPCPGDGYVWIPGYYQYGEHGYYWVSGHWVVPPGAGQLWTPGYWGLEGGLYKWHAGYWGTRVGFYGGINYGNGYFGTGFTGGRWQGNDFHHNTAVVRVDERNVHHVYEDRTVVKEVRGPNHAFNGQGGAQARPTREEQEFSRAPHGAPTREQVAHAEEAHNNHLAAHGAPRGKEH